MDGLRRVSRPAAVTAAVVVVQVVVGLLVVLLPSGGTPHEVPVAISGPIIIAESMAEQADQRTGTALDAHAVASAQTAREEVRRGTAVAAIDIDLRRDRATLYVASAQGEQMTRAVASSVRTIAGPFGVTVATRDLVPTADVPGASWALRVLVAAAVALGLALAVVVTWRRGPVADTRPESARRVLVVVGTASGAAAIGATAATVWVGGAWPGWWAVLALTSIAVGGLTLALEGVLGVAGVGLSVTAALATAAPLVRVDHALLLAEPWRTVTPWLPHGAALDAVREIAYFGGAGALRPVAVLVAWTVVSYVVLVVARRERLRAGVRWSDAARGDATTR
ncbi:hypothetical protein IFT73_15545 [Aeromicrobium sp. CFBP 8757]|uniref:hypothetical protein n=1 Tax=Aeromicrobium sp. CFBP 8757 TaxID=2775288 RepID=UPI00178096AA|nr:hypothetical protein [Aeromicrobium sp. CFBP 8757]MBD8608271.1 hypothetical protein [Aeromicrobium sp. CFBP 8757]